MVKKKKEKREITNIFAYFLGWIFSILFAYSVIEWFRDSGFNPSTLVIISGIGLFLLIVFGIYKIKD